MASWSDVSLNALSPDFRLDAEHYQPAYLAQEKAMTRLQNVPLSSVATVSDGNHLSIADDFSEAGVRYLRGQDLSDFFISDADPIYIPEKTYKQLSRSHMFPGDILLGIVGTIGTVGMVTSRHGALTGNCKLAIIRTKSLPPEYIAAYLTSRVGQNEIQRRTRGAVQMGLILPDLRTMPIVVPGKAVLSEIVALVQSAERQRENARALFDRAESLMVENLGLSHIDYAESQWYERSATDLTNAGRFGAEYFMPCKRNVIEALGELPGKRLGDIFASVREMFDPKTDARKDLDVRNFDLSHAIDRILDDRVGVMPSLELGSTKKVMMPGDLAVSRLRYYLREIAIVRSSETPKIVGSSEFIVLRQRPDVGQLSIEALLIYLCSLPVQTILKWSQDGSQHPRFTEADLLNIPVPDLVLKMSTEIRGLVNKALRSREDANSMLASAKAKVEELVFASANG
jgi:hypothetical protein